MTEMLYFKRNKKTSNDIPDEVKSLNYNTDLLNETFIETVYSSNDEVKYLFKILEALWDFPWSRTRYSILSH
uniref:hypothetical protein n=3 Tax=Thiothrix TaxID=1030 RepID=UPI002609905A